MNRNSGQHHQTFPSRYEPRNHNNNVGVGQSSWAKAGPSQSRVGEQKYHFSSATDFSPDNNNRYHQQMSYEGISGSHYRDDEYLSEAYRTPPGPNYSHYQSLERREFVPSFILMDACKGNNERKVREICRKLSSLPEEEAQLVANFQDESGRSSLSHACSGASISIIEELSRIRTIDPNLPDNDGNSPLHYASQGGLSEVVDLLIARFGDNLDLNGRNCTGLTPLMKAALQGRTRCAKSLLSSGAAPYLRDYSRNLTAAEWARLCGRHICAEVITRGAKDHHRQSTTSSTSMNFQPHQRSNIPLPTSRSDMELRRMNSDDSPYYHLYGRSTMSGANWLKNKIKKALGTGGSTGSGASLRTPGDKRPTLSEGSCTLMGGATICAGSLLLPSIKPLIEQQRTRHAMANKKLAIPTLQVTPVKR